MKKILITGGAGFIGSALVRQLITEDSDTVVINVDKLTYAGNLGSLDTVAQSPRYYFERADICDTQLMRDLFCHYTPEAVVHLASETHVDRSIDGPAAFVQTNILGTYTLLEVARDYWASLRKAPESGFRFVHVSTDEVFGSLGSEGYFREISRYCPGSPYAASKAAADHLVAAWYKTYGLPAIITNCSNNFGPYQFPEKLIPLMIVTALEEKPLPVYGDGQNVRDWLFVEDHCRALQRVLEAGRIGESYNIGAHNERTNLEIVNRVCRTLDGLQPRRDGSSYTQLITFVEDRPGHDRRYAIDPEKIQRELDWAPQEDFESALVKTVRWYLDNRTWWERVRNGSYRGERLGVFQ